MNCDANIFFKYLKSNLNFKIFQARRSTTTKKNIDALLQYFDDDEKSMYQSIQADKEVLMKLAKARNFAREECLKFERLAEHQKKKTLKLQIKSLKLGKRISQLQNQIHIEPNNSQEGGIVDR